VPLKLLDDLKLKVNGLILIRVNLGKNRIVGYIDYEQANKLGTELVKSRVPSVKI